MKFPTITFEIPPLPALPSIPRLPTLPSLLQPTTPSWMWPSARTEAVPAGMTANQWIYFRARIGQYRAIIQAADDEFETGNQP